MSEITAEAEAHSTRALILKRLEALLKETRALSEEIRRTPKRTEFVGAHPAFYAMIRAWHELSQAETMLRKDL